MLPFTKPSWATRSSSACDSTSTMALPMPSTSRSAGSAMAAPRGARGEVTIEEQGELAAHPRREHARVGDHGGLEGIGTSLRARFGHERDDPAEHLPGGGYVLHEIGDHGLHGDRVVLVVPDVVVGDEGQRGVAQLCLAGELGLGHVGHADDRDAPAAVDLRLALGGELGPLDADVGTTAMHSSAHVAPRLNKHGGEAGAHGMGHTYVGHDAVAEEGARPSPRVVVELVGYHEVERVDAFLHAPDRADGKER